MRYFLFAILALFSVAASAAPFVRATVSAGTTECGFYLDAGAVVVVPASGTSCQIDIGTIAVGAHVVAADARATTDPAWGTQISAKSPPLNFTRPGVPAVPSSLVLAP
jgi:hypothetical protein